jgi:glycosyltransferase involved in cell wall biosynthesis
MNSQLPLISCVCVTRKKPGLLKRSIECFLAQTYLHKELIIIYEDDDPATEAFVATGFPAESGIRIFRVPSCPKTTLGELRNFAIRAAGGEFVCQWDDDDWYHARRLELQFGKLPGEGRHGSIMKQWLVYDSLSTTAYISNVRLWEGSILCRKSVLQQKAYEDKALGEDSATIEYLASMDSLHFLDEMPGLYIYVYHGNNTWGYQHWNEIFQCSTAIAPEDSRIIGDILNGKYPVGEASILLDVIVERSSINN